jgi:membrane protease YdiL (CAAX protease family)
MASDPAQPQDAVEETDPRRWASIVEVTLATVLAGLGILGIEKLSVAVPAVGSQAGALVAALFVGIALVAGRLRRFRGDVLGLDGAPMWHGVRLGLLASLIILPLFAVGFDLWQTRVVGTQRGAGPGWTSPGLEFQGAPLVVTGRVVVQEQAGGVRLQNGLERPLQVLPACQEKGCEVQVLRPGGQVLLQGAAQRQFAVQEADGRPLDQPVYAGAAAVPQQSPLRAEHGWAWLLWMLLGQFAAVALPEEMFFRGYVLGRLRSCLRPRHTVLGVPFGWAHVLSALLFAAVHLFAVPEAHRLLVFFPGLLFAWLAERGRTVVAAAVHHTLANATLQLLQRLYG